MTASLILASKSETRRTMLENAGVAFRVSPAEIDERALEADMGEAPADRIALALASAKAVAVSRREPTAWALGSDSLVECDGRRFDKPESRAQAAEHLRFFSGRTMRLHSAAALARGGEEAWQTSALASLDVRDLSEAFIAGYLDAEWPAVGASVGVFRIEGRGVQLFRAIEGDHFTVLGMPLLPVLGALREHGVLTP